MSLSVNTRLTEPGLAVVFFGTIELYALWQEGRRQRRKRQAEGRWLDEHAKHS